MLTLVPYAIGGALISAGAGGIGSVVILFGILRDWRFWLIGCIAFLVGMKAS